MSKHPGRSIAGSRLFEAIGAGPKLCPKHQARVESRVMSPSKINRANVRGRAVGKPPAETHATWNVRDPRILCIETSNQAINRGANNYNPGKFTLRSIAVGNRSIGNKGKSLDHCKPHDISRTRVDREQKIKHVYRLQHLPKNIHL